MEPCVSGSRGRPGIEGKNSGFKVTIDKITYAIKALARVTEAISAWLLFSGGRSGSLMPVAQFDPFERLDKPIMRVGGESEAHKVWNQLSDERDCYLEGVGEELVQRVKSGP